MASHGLSEATISSLATLKLSITKAVTGVRDPVGDVAAKPLQAAIFENAEVGAVKDLVPCSLFKGGMEDAPVYYYIPAARAWLGLFRVLFRVV